MELPLKSDDTSCELKDAELDAVQGGFAGFLVVLIAVMGAATAAYVEPAGGHSSGKGSGGTY